MLDHVLRAFALLIKSGELGAADGRSLNILSPELDQQGEIGRDELIALLFAGSKDPDGACRSFLSRLKAAAQQAAEQAEQRGEEQAAAVFRSITVARIKAKGGTARLKFSAQVPKELPPVTARANRDYLPENYQPSTGCNQEELSRLQQQELSRRQEKPLCCHIGFSRLADYCSDEFEPTIGNRHCVNTSGKITLIDSAIKAIEARFNKNKEEAKASCEALADLFDWLENSKTSLYALLGDYGMGKTFTCRVFAQRLAERCENEPHLPKPVYLDLRDVPTFVTVDGKTRQPTLEEMLQEVLRLAEKGADYSAEELIEAARKGLLLLIFDGLDEKLVYYTNDMRSQFLNELLRVFPQDGRAGVKIVISCRTHHFETISQMDSFLLGLNRSGVQGEDYRALHLLPFSSSQILRLLTRLLGSEDANRIFSFIDSEAYLKDLAQRPFMLRQLSRTLPDLQRMKSQGLPVNAAAFYQALIADSISRDDEKHILKPRHKQQLLIDLAAAFWQESTQVWQIDRLNDWFCAWLEARPALAAQYQKEDWQVLEKDLRNSTLLVRFGEQDFGFSHSSMQEFFLSKWLLRQWQEDDQFRMEQPLSSLTRQFVFDNLALLDKKELERINKGLAATLARPWSEASDLALDIIAELAQQKRTLPELGDVDLRHSFLSNRQIRGLHGQRLLLDQAEAHASQWLDCHFQQIDIGQGNISGSLWRDCSWQHIVGAKNFSPLQDGMTLANCRINGAVHSSVVGAVREPPLQHLFPPAARQTAQEPFRPEDWRQGHSGWVISCAFSPDGTRILSAAWDNTLKLWDLEGNRLCTIHTERINSCCFSRAGRILSASENGILSIWDTNGDIILSFQGHKDTIDSCAFSPDGTLMLSASHDKTLKLWNAEGCCLKIFQGHQYRLTDCAFNPDGMLILSASADKTIKLWNLEGNCLQTFQGHEGYVESCTFSPDGTRILSASSDQTIRLWDLKGNTLLTLNGHNAQVTCCVFSPDGTRILSASWDNTLKLWDLEGHCLQTFQGHEGHVESCTFSPDGTRILSASWDNTLKLWDLEGSCLQTFQGYKGEINDCIFSMDNRYIVSAHRDMTLKLWSHEGHYLNTIRGHSGGIFSIDFSADGSRVVSASSDKTLKIWDLEGNCIQTMRGHNDWIRDCSFNSYGSRIVSASLDNTLRIWDLEGNCLNIMRGHEDGVTSCCFSPDDIYIISASNDATLKIWDLAGNCLKTIRGHKYVVTNCIVSPDGTRILSVSWDKTMKLWDMEGNCLTVINVDKGGRCICFSPDGSQILFGSRDGILNLFDLGGNSIQTFEGHTSWVTSCSFSSDGKNILSASADGSLRLWNLDGTLERICAAGRGQWHTAFFADGQLEKIIGTELSWKMANFAKDGKTWTLDETGCFEWVPAQY